jgi:formamidopyrimidine-DNA glycosylase
MPELPEVETIKNELLPMVSGRKIIRVEFMWPKTLFAPSQSEFDRAIKGRRITMLSRRGKYLVFKLDDGNMLLVHLRMTGSFLAGKEGSDIPGHTRAIIFLDDGIRLFFVDPRKFGKFQLVKETNEVLEKLGPEPLEASFTAKVLAELLAIRKAPIKAVLVDQTIIAGIGNMYADEALFLARIHPLRLADSLSADETKRLRTAIREVLTEAIENKGASISNYFRPGGEVGHAHQQFKVAHRKDEGCPVCGRPLNRIIVRQRGTYFCPHCQPEASPTT